MAKGEGASWVDGYEAAESSVMYKKCGWLAVMISLIGCLLLKRGITILDEWLYIWMSVFVTQNVHEIGSRM